MARIPQVELERLKTEVSVERLVEASGVKLRGAGKDLIGCCPFHEDAEASLVVTPAKNLWHCFSCQIGGGPIDWVMKAKGLSFRHAVELLREEAFELLARPGRTRVLAVPVSLDADDHALLAQAIDYYHERLKGSTEALAYLERRGLKDANLIERFRIGFADRTLGLRLPQKTRKAGAEIRGRLQKIGLWRESGHEHFNGSIVIPVVSTDGAITEIYGRKINDNLRPGTPMHLYLPGAHRGVWNETALAASPEVILCEALIDAMTFWRAGFHNVTASYGIEGFTADHLSAFKRQRIERVLIAYDRDEPGERAAVKLAAQLIEEGLDCYRILFPKGMDANEYALKVGPAAKSLGVAIRSAQWMGKGKPKPLPAISAVITVANSARDPAPAISLAAEEAAKKEIPAAQPTVPDPSSAPLPAPEAKPLGHERELVLSYGPRRYRVRGLDKNLSYELLKVNLMASVSALDGVGQRMHVDTLDLYHARARAAFAQQAAIELGVGEEVLRGDLGKLLLALEAEQEKLIVAAAQPRMPASVSMSEEERKGALELLKSPALIERIVGDFGRAGIVGERTNVLVGYLAAISRKLDRPLALLVQSTSAAGKSSLMDAVLKLVPEEDRIVYSAMTGQALFYMGEMDLKHKILAIAEEEGAHRASYALKLLQSEGELTIASTSKNPETGKLTTDEYHVEGPVMIFSTTTAADLDEELKNRCLVLAVDESREQTAAIHRAQRERRTLAGLQAHAERAALFKLHQNAQRLLEPLAVLNPYASALTFLDDRTRTRRDHEKYLTLIDAVALLHQHQRMVRTAVHAGQTVRYVEVTLDDIALANSIAHEVLGRSLDELPPQTRQLLTLIAEMVERGSSERALRRTDYRFSRRQVREYTRWGDTQLKIHLARLVELEYLLVHRGGRGQSFEYELLYDGTSDGERHLSGLIDIEALRAMRSAQRYDGERSEQNAAWSAPGRALVAVQSVAGRMLDEGSTAEKPSLTEAIALEGQKMHGTRGNGQIHHSSTLPL
jgi:DNA primase